jgi:hypothetical protein
MKKETVLGSCQRRKAMRCNRTSNSNFMIILYRTDLSRLMNHKKLQRSLLLTVHFAAFICFLSPCLHNWMTLDALISFYEPSLDHRISLEMGQGLFSHPSLHHRVSTFLCSSFVDWREATNCTGVPLIIRYNSDFIETYSD